MSNSPIVHIYTDHNKTSLFDTIPIVDDGNVTGGAVEPTSEGSLINLAKRQLREQGRATDREIEGFYYEVEREEDSSLSSEDDEEDYPDRLYDETEDEG
jgi:hypothetical protein